MLWKSIAAEHGRYGLSICGMNSTEYSVCLVGVNRLSAYISYCTLVSQVTGVG